MIDRLRGRRRLPGAAERIRRRTARARLGLAALLAVPVLGCGRVAALPPCGQAPAPVDAVARPARDLASLRRDVEAVAASLHDDRRGAVYARAVPGTDPDALAIAVTRTDGRSVAVGAASTEFPFMSVSKPFTFALALEQRGVAFMAERVGVDATGLPYNSLAAGAVRPTTAQNPMVNAGAIATHSYLVGDDPAAKIRAVLDLYSRMAGRPLEVEAAWRAEPRALTYALAHQMKSADRLEGDPHDAARRYLESNVVALHVGDLARMGATLASGGVRPDTGERVLRRETVRAVLSAMAVAGMYEDSGRWWTEVGLPAKSGVSGAVLAVAPGWGALAAWSPRLDAAGNSVRAAGAIRALAQRWGLHAFERLLEPGTDACPPAAAPEEAQ